MADYESKERMSNLLRQLDSVDLEKLTLEDLRSVKNPVLARFLNDFVTGQLQRASGHTSHLDHLSHYSSSLRTNPGDIEQQRG